MKTLVLYGTTEGQTRKVAEFVAEKLRDMGDTVTLSDATTIEWDFWPGGFDAAIVAASIHAGRYQTAIVRFAQCYYEYLNRMPTLFLSVSLSAATPQDAEGMAVIARTVESLAHESGWKLDAKHVAGAFRFTEYDFFKRWVMRLVAWEKGTRQVSRGGDLELTDWAALETIVRDFRSRASTQLTKVCA